MFIGMIFNEVPGNESRQWDQVILDVLAQPPSMKCREMNPGNALACRACGALQSPSMKCREMNPGNLILNAHDKILDCLPSMKCREMNPGNASFASQCPGSLSPQ